MTRTTLRRISIVPFAAFALAALPASAEECKSIHADLVEMSSTTGCNAGESSCFLGVVDGNQGLGGYRVEWAASEPVKARVGELVGLAQVAADVEALDWMVGIIRWIRIGPDAVVDAGLELLAREARPAALRAIDGSGRPRPPVRAIQLASLEHDQVGLEGYRIVAPSVLERSAAQFELTVAPNEDLYGEETEVQTLPDVTLIEQTGAYLLLAPLGAEPLQASTPDPALEPA